MAAQRAKRTSLSNLTSGKAEAILLERARQGREELYDSLRIADHLLKDETFLANHDGKYDDAVEYLEDKYFALVRHTLRLDEMLELLTHFAEKQWAEYNYDLRAMYALREQSREGEPSARKHHNYKKMYEDHKARAEDLQRQLVIAHGQLAEARSRIQIMEGELSVLRSKVAELSGDNSFVKGRLMELEKMEGATL